MTPTEYLEIEKGLKQIIKTAQSIIFEARTEADKCPPPKNRRSAKASDIMEGVIIWHEREKQYGDDFWNIVAEPLHYGDPFKAYVADDGCRYGIEGAYVEEI